MDRAYRFDQYEKVIDYLNKKRDRNICLRTALVIIGTDTYYSYPINVMERRDDISKRRRTEIKPYDNVQYFVDDFNSQIKKKLPFCFFVLYANRDGSHSHINLGIYINDKVYRYDSGIHDKAETSQMDESLKKVVKLDEASQMDASLMNVIGPVTFYDTISWCPMKIQGDTPLCAFYVFHIYNMILLTNPYIIKTRPNWLVDMIKHSNPSNVEKLRTELTRNVIPQGIKIDKD